MWVCINCAKFAWKEKERRNGESGGKAGKVSWREIQQRNTANKDYIQVQNPARLLNSPAFNINSY